MALLFAKNNSLSAVTALPAAVSGGGLNLISTQTASSSATIDFTSGIDSTYKEYIFKFYDMHPSDTNVDGFKFQGSTDGGSNYNLTITSTYFRSTHDESGSNGAVAYQASQDQGNGTSFQNISQSIGNDNDQSGAGILHLFDPSSTTFVKHFLARTNNAHQSDKTRDVFTGGYFNTTSAINAIQFKMSAGNIDSGVIKMYGVT
jgi:hypothetical protein